MIYFVIGLLFAIGWGVGKLIIDILYEITFERLHKSQRYMRICGQVSDQVPDQPDRKIGF